MSDVRVGLLAFQGDYEAHGKALARTGIASITIVEVRRLQTSKVSIALIIPGGGRHRHGHAPGALRHV